MRQKGKMFLDENGEPSAAFMAQLFDGITPRQLDTAITTLLQLDENLKKM